MTDSIPASDLEEMVKASEDQGTMLNAVDQLFANCEAPEITLPSGTKVEIKLAKVKQLKEMTAFITGFLSSLDTDAVIGLISKVSEFQEEEIKGGSSFLHINTLGKVQDVLGSASIISTIMMTGMERIPMLIPMFTDMTEESFGELDLDEGFMVAFHILGRNYSFFTQRCAPVIHAYIALMRSKRPQKKTK